jgi:hypothetical protein
MAAFARLRIFAGSFLSSLGTAAWRRTLYFVPNLFPGYPGTASAFFDQSEIFGILQPLRDSFLNNRLYLQTVLFAVGVQELLKLFVDPMCDCDHQL